MNLLIFGAFGTLTVAVLEGWGQVLDRRPPLLKALLSMTQIALEGMRDYFWVLELGRMGLKQLEQNGLGWNRLSWGDILVLTVLMGLVGMLGYQLLLGRSQGAEQLPCSFQPFTALRHRVVYSPVKSRTDLRLERLKLDLCQRPQDPNVWLEMGAFLEYLRKYREASVIYAEGLTHHPRHPQLWFSHGFSHAQSGDFSQALRSYSAALQQQPNHSEFWHAHGDALLGLGRYSEALDSLQRVRRYSPHFGSVWSDRGLALYKLGRYEEAAEALRQAVKRDPRDEQSWFYWGEALRMSNQLPAAQKNIRKALRIHPYSELLQRQERHLLAQNK